MTEQNLDHAQVRVAPPLVFLSYLIGALIVGWLIPFPTPWTFALRVVGGLMVILGFLLAGLAVSQMMKLHTSPDPHQSVSTLVTGGPYGFSRNPIYLGFFLIYLGFTLFAGTLWGLLASPFLFWTITHAVIHAEEIYLEDKFGDTYKEYRSRVRQWI